MAPKKKKTQLKPVARGFATTSVPKKIVPETPPEEELPSSNGHGTDDASQTLDAKGSTTVGTDGGNRDPEAAKEQSLQALVDKLQDKTEKEISRILKALEVDRRFAQTLPSFDIDPVLRDRIIELAQAPVDNEGAKKLDASEEKNLTRLGVIYGVLRRMGFSETRAVEALNSIQSLDLDEALDWLYLHCNEWELTKDDENQIKISRTTSGSIKITALSPPSTPRSAVHPLQFTRSMSNQKTPSTPTSNTKADLTSLKSQILSSLPSIAASDNELEESTYRYVQLKLKLDEVIRQPRHLHQAEKRALQELIAEQANDYLFNDKEALKRYTVQRQALDLQKLSMQESSTPEAPAADVLPPPSPAPSSKGQNSTPTSSDDSDDGEFLGGVLGILEDAAAGEISEQGVLFKFKDMSLPKSWSGQMPKTLLRDLVTRNDRYATVTYTNISGQSRASRSNIVIGWRSGKREEWTMDDVACQGDSQAEQYIATLALHSLTYPLTEGFAAVSPPTSGSHTSFRLLPAVYRDLWDELENARREKCALINRKTWNTLRGVLEARLVQETQTAEKTLKAGLNSSESRIPRHNLDGRDTASIEYASASFRGRQTTMAYQTMLAQRNELPISRYRGEIIQALETSQVLVLSGETGCGKSTQLPAFILEDALMKGEHCRIYCTEPRRISALSLAHRVSYELCDPLNSVGTAQSLVGYSIRLESNIHRNTRLAFVTNGIALRMLEGGSGQGGQGSAFDEVTHIIVDEVHERTIESDFLLIVLKSLIQERPHLKVVLMSATIDAEKISAYFGNCQILQVPGRTFPVDIRFLEDAIETTKWSISETSPYARRVNDKYYKGKNWSEDLPSADDDDDDDSAKQVGEIKLERRYSPETTTTLNTIDERLIPYDLIIRLLEVLCYEDSSYTSFSNAILVFLPGLGEIRRLNDLLSDHAAFGTDAFRIFPLHSTLSNDAQSAVFDTMPPGVRKIVIATNIAETGITIPDITCVIDSGKHREMRFDEKRQISRLIETFIARSNAAQRRGRAGRVQAGLCFHLFTKLRHDTLLADHPLPEMMRLSLSDLALRIKIMKVKLGSSIEDVLSRALDPPIPVNVQRAVSALVEVRALTPLEEITSMGRLLSKLPTDVHLGKFLLVATLFRCLDTALTIAATLNSKSPFITPLGLEGEADRAKNSFRTDNSDFLTIHNAFSSWRKACANSSYARKFCRINFLSHQNLQQIEDLRQQFLGYLVDSSFIKVDSSLIRELNRARYSRGRTRFVTVPPELDLNSSNPYVVHAALAAGLYPKILTVDSKGSICTLTNNQPVSVHPSSVNFGRDLADFNVNYLSFFTLMHSKRLYAWEIGPVDELALVLLCGECEWKLKADSVIIDRKIKLRISPRTGIALKLLRDQISNLLAQQYKGKPLSTGQREWEQLALSALGRVKLNTEPVVANVSSESQAP